DSRSPTARRRSSHARSDRPAQPAHYPREPLKKPRTLAKFDLFQTASGDPMSQLTFAEAEYAVKKRKTRRELFLEKLEALLPWKQLEAPIAKHYACGGMGRPPYPLSAMLRVLIMQLVYNLSDPAMEDALYEIESMRRFAGIRLDRVPDETTILNFRHLLEQHK